MQTPATLEPLKFAGECAAERRMMSQEASFLRRSKILIVDDDTDLSELLRLILQQAGYRHVECITDPVGALDFVQQWKPNLVILDLRMPGVDGMNVLTELRLLVPDKPRLPILVLSGDASMETRSEALGCGASDFAAKPFETHEMVARIGHLLETRFSPPLARHEAGGREMRHDGDVFPPFGGCEAAPARGTRIIRNKVRRARATSAICCNPY